MPLTRQQTTKKTTRAPNPSHLLRIPPPKLKNTPQRTLTASNSQTPTAQTTTQHAPEDTPSLHLKYPNSYNITLASPPLEPDQRTTLTPTDSTTVQIENTPPPDITQIPAMTTPTNPIESTDTPNTDTGLTEQPPTSDSNSNATQSPKKKPTSTPSTASHTNNDLTRDPIAIQDELFKLKTQHTKVIHHTTFLNTCIHDNFVPQGFRISLTLQAMEPDHTNIQEDWEQALLDTSKQLVELTHTHYTLLLATITEKIEELETLLNNLDISMQHKQLTDTQMHKLTTLEKRLETTRTNKIHRLKNPTPQQVSNNKQSHFLVPTQKHHVHTRQRPPPAPPTHRRTLLPTPSNAPTTWQPPHTQRRTLLPTPPTQSPPLLHPLPQPPYPSPLFPPQPPRHRPLYPPLLPLLPPQPPQHPLLPWNPIQPQAPRT